MQRVKRSTAVAVLPADPAGGTPGYFPNPDPGGGVPAAVPGYEWYNNIQEEVIAPILAAGLTLDGNDRTQLLQAINRLIATASVTRKVRVATTAAINLAAPGATIDAATMAAGDRFLDKDNATAASRGVYVWNGAAVPATRATDADSAGDMFGGMLVAVSEGTANGNSLWMLTTNDQITIGTTALTFEWVAGPAITPAQFDAGTKLATTEFVQRALGNDRGFLGLTANANLDATYCGKIIYANTSAAITLTLPAANAMPAGSKFTVIATGAGSVTVTRSGTDQIVLSQAASPVNSVTLLNGDSLIIESLGSGSLWYHAGGSAQLKYAGVFGSSIAASGWQKLPSDLIIQWGQVTNSATPGNPTGVTFPVAFPTACLSVSNMAVNAATTNSAAWGDSLAASSFNSRCAVANLVSKWIAIGY